MTDQSASGPFRRFAALGRSKRFWLFALLGTGLVAGVVVGVGKVSDAKLISADPDVAARDIHMLNTAIGPGAAVYRARCASCHGLQAKGDGQGVPDLTDQDWLYGSGNAGEIEWIVLHGIRAHDAKTWNLADMPAYAKQLPYPREPAIDPFSPRDVNDMVEFLLALQRKPADIAAARRGEAIYNDRGACYDCHGNDGTGDSAIGAPNLVDDIWLYGGSRADIARSLSAGHAGKCPAWAKALDPVEVRQAALYVYSLSHKTPE